MSANNGMIVLITFLFAMVVSIMPMPLSIDAFRPDWVLAVLVYWAIALPYRVNVFTAGFLGFLLDVLLGGTIGIHSAAMAIVVYIATVNCQKIRNFSLWQQSLVVGTLATLYHLLLFWLQRFLSDVVFLPSYLYPVSTTVILWPWLFLLLRKIRRHFKIT